MEESKDPMFNSSFDTLMRISNLIKTIQTQILNHSNNRDIVLSLKLLKGELNPNVKESESKDLSEKIKMAEQNTNVHNILNAYDYALYIARMNKLTMIDKPKVNDTLDKI